MTITELAGAIFSPCRKYRYLLWRDLGKGEGTLAFLCLNPSTADELTNDPTVERCITRATTMGFRRFEMLNLFAWRSTDPKGLIVCPQDPIGPENDTAIMDSARQARMLVCAWGTASPLIPKRAGVIVAALNDAGVKLHALKIGKTGQPHHPLYRAYSELPFEWRP